MSNNGRVKNDLTSANNPKRTQKRVKSKIQTTGGYIKTMQFIS